MLWTHKDASLRLTVEWVRHPQNRNSHCGNVTELPTKHDEKVNEGRKF